MSFSLASFAVTFLIFYGIFCLLMWRMKRRRLYELASKIEGPLALPIIGNLYMLLGKTESILNKLVNTYASYPSPCRLWFGPYLCFAITDPEQVKEICMNPSSLDKGELFRNVGEVFLGTGLVTAPVAKWQVHRKLIQPTFNKKIVDSYFAIFNTQAKIFADKIERYSDGPEFETFKLLSLCTLDMICESALGVEINAQSNGNCRYGDALQQVVDSFSYRLFNLWLLPNFIYDKTTRGKEQRRNLEYLHGFAENVIKMKRIELQERNNRLHDTVDDKNDSPYMLPVREAFLDHLMKLTDETGALSDKELREEVDTLIVAGNHGNAMTISFTLLMLASHPEIQEKAYEELYEIYGDFDPDERPMKLDDLTRMKYLDCIIKETLRLFPPIPFIIRQITKELNLGEQILPQDSYVAIGILSLQRNEKYWSNPLKFIPERFLSDANSNQRSHPNAFIAFSIGPRNCIGQSYALMSIKTVMATVLRRYILKKNNILPVKDIDLSMNVVLKPMIPNALKIEMRTKNRTALRNLNNTKRN